MITDEIFTCVQAVKEEVDKGGLTVNSLGCFTSPPKPETTVADYKLLADNFIAQYIKSYIGICVHCELLESQTRLGE